MPDQSTPHVKDYDRLTRLVDQRLGLYARRTIEEAITMARFEGTETVLDACCGTGELLQLLALHGHRGSLVGVDFSETMLHVANHRLQGYPNITLKKERIEAMSLPSDYFHLIFNTNVLHYFDQPAEIFGEFYRLLRPHGRLILADLTLDSWLMRIWLAIRRLIRPSYRKLYQLDTIIKLLEQTGFTVTQRRVFRTTMVWSVMILEAQRPAPQSRRTVTPSLEEA